jgi:hypothetical protein
MRNCEHSKKNNIIEAKKLLGQITNEELEFIKNNSKMFENNKNLEDELNKIDEVFDKDLEKLNLIEEQNEIFLSSLNLDKSIDTEKTQEKLDEKMNKNMKVLDSNLIMKIVPEIKDIEKEEDKISCILNSKMFILCDKKIGKIENLEIYQNLEELYLQRNFIKKIDNFNHNLNLQVLSLNNNYIKTIQNLKFLKNLKILDISDNVIEDFSAEELPNSLVYLFLFDNLFYDKIPLFNFRSQCIKSLPNIINIDGLTIHDEEKLILIDFKPNKKTNEITVNKRLKYISEYYEKLKLDRRIAITQYLNGLESFEEEQDNLEIAVLKERSKERFKKFENNSSERMKSIREKLSEVRTNFETTNSKFDIEAMDRIKQKIKNSMKFDSKMDDLDMKIVFAQQAQNHQTDNSELIRKHLSNNDVYNK